MPEEIIYKIFAGSASETEKEQFFKAIAQNSEEREEFIRYKNILVASEINSAYSKPNKNDNFDKFWCKVHQKNTRKITIQFMKYAAVFIAALTLGFFTFHFSADKTIKIPGQFIEYSTGKGSISTVNLPDGSAIWLSSGTKLSIETSTDGEITARLNGEAYFDLIPDKNRKFSVDLGHFRIKDIGTKFNVRSYIDEKIISSSLIEGSIELLNSNDISFLTVKPGESANFDKASRSVRIVNKDASIVTAWKEGKFVFIDKPLSEICKELENWYNIDIRIENEKLAGTRYTSVIKRSTTVEMVLKILALTDKIKYEITDKPEGKDEIIIRK